MQSESRLTKPLFIAAFLFFALVVSRPVTAQTNNQILSLMNEHGDRLTSVKADIKMTEFEATLADETVREGVVQYKPKKGRDAYFRIDWESPNDVLIVAAGKYLLWRKRLNQVISGMIDDAAKQKGTNNVLKFWGMSKAQLTKNYKVVNLGRSSVSGTKAWHLKLTPKGAESFTEAHLWIDRYGMVIQAKLVKKNKDSTTIRLSRIRKDEPIKDAVFSPDLKGVDILDA